MAGTMPVRDDNLPPNWAAFKSGNGPVFYHNQSTGDLTYERPRAPPPARTTPRHAPPPPPFPPARFVNQSKYKTEMCEDWLNDGECPRGDRCNFAHARKELRAEGAKTNPQTAAFINRGGRGHPSSAAPFGSRNQGPSNIPPLPNTSATAAAAANRFVNEDKVVQALIASLQLRIDRFPEERGAVELFKVARAKSVKKLCSDLKRIKEIAMGSELLQVEGRFIAFMSQVPQQQGLSQPYSLDENFCTLCGFQCRSKREMDVHLVSARHRIRLTQQCPNKEDFSSNKGGVIVDVLSPETCQIGDQYVRHLSIYNQGGEPVNLLSFNLIKKRRNVSVLDREQSPPPGKPQVLGPGQVTRLTITVTADAYGVCGDALILDFGSFQIPRSIKVHCQAPLPDGITREDLAPKEAYTPKKKENPRPRKEDFIPGVRPPRQVMKWTNNPGNEKPPQWMVTEMFDQKTTVKTAAKIEMLVRKLESHGGLLADRCQLMKLLLHTEELQHEIDVQQYNIEGARLIVPQRGRETFKLNVPGLAENRPSVVRGDSIHVELHGKVWEGCVHRVEKEQLVLKFHSDFHRDWMDGPVNVSFCIRRSGFIFMQYALTRAMGSELHPAVLMGGGNWLRSPAYITGEPPFTEDLNNEQKEAVRSILRAEHAPLPFLIFGPPGTGKTKTLTEAAYQIYKMDPTSRILLVAPSNSATDLLAIKMLEKGCPKSSVHRINAFSRPIDLPIDLAPVSNSDDDGSGYVMPELSVIKSKRIVAVTCLMAAKLYAHGCTNFFTHVFLDEAGHAEEPLTACITGLVPLSSQRCRIVMAGDPKQLGPVVLSSLAQKHGLSVSTFERLVDTQPYARDRAEDGSLMDLDKRYICKLIVNYRSHPSILKVPNAAFYDNELVCGASVESRESLLAFSGIDRFPRKKVGKGSFPIVFHAIVGEDEREKHSPSWFNINEAAVVTQYTMALLDQRYSGFRPKPIDIGIISPYRKQVERIRTLVHSKISKEIKVGSVEEFQGQERLAIIVSTVRSNPDHLTHDEKFRLGFLRNPKRFNVAVTRAKGMLIVVGNPDVLCHDPHWLKFMRFAYHNGGWVGSEAPESVMAAAVEDEGDVDGIHADQERLLDQFSRFSMAHGSSDGHREESQVQEEGGEMPTHDD